MVADDISQFLGLEFELPMAVPIFPTRRLHRCPDQAVDMGIS